MMAVTSFLRWPLERVFHGEECVVSAGSDGNMEFCSCSANSSKASGSVEAMVGSVDGKGEAESRMGSECSLWVVGSGSISSMVGAGAGGMVFVFHCLSGPKSVVHRSRCERWRDDLRGPSVWDAVDADGGLLWASGCRVVVSGSFLPERLPGAAFASSGCPGQDHSGPTFLVKHDWGRDVSGVKIVHQRFLHR